MQIGNRDIEKMLDYYSKGSRPEVLARTVKDLNKAMSRAVIANAMGWKGCSSAFIKRCKELGATDADISEVERMCDTYELPSEYRSKFENGPKLEDASRLRDWFPKLFKVLRDYKVQNIKLKTRKPTRDELEKDSRDGRCWTLAYTVSFDHNGKHYDWDIANHSNEGGGSFGVSAKSPLSVYQGTQQELADKAEYILDRDVSESVSNVVNDILNGKPVRRVIMESSISKKKLSEKSVRIWDSDIAVNGVRLLTVDEYNKFNRQSDLRINAYWWLGSPAEDSDYDVYFVRPDSSIGTDDSGASYGVRPVIEVADDIKADEVPMYGGHRWIYLTKNLLLCDKPLFNLAFDSKSETNVYSRSDVKVALDRWFAHIEGKNETVSEAMDMFGMDDSFFTKEELVEFAYAVEDDVNEEFKSVNSPFSIGYTGVWMEDDDRTVTMDFVCLPNETDYSASIKIDMRNIKAPGDLFKYVEKMAAKVKEIVNKEEVSGY